MAFGVDNARLQRPEQDLSGVFSGRPITAAYEEMEIPRDPRVSSFAMAEDIRTRLLWSLESRGYRIETEGKNIYCFGGRFGDARISVQPGLVDFSYDPQTKHPAFGHTFADFVRNELREAEHTRRRARFARGGT